jgi:hypothetical protein
VVRERSAKPLYVGSIPTRASINSSTKKYTYDGDGNRLQKSSGKIYWYGAGSEVLDESDSSDNISDDYVYFAGKRIAHRVVRGNVISYYGEDSLGSSRQIYTSTSALCYDSDFYSFGGERILAFHRLLLCTDFFSRIGMRSCIWQVRPSNFPGITVRLSARRVWG